MANRRNGTIYTGSTSIVAQRAWQHREGMVEGFTKQHGCTMLVWFAQFDDLEEARRRELQMKKWKRAWKIRLIEDSNPNWRDLWFELNR